MTQQELIARLTALAAEAASIQLPAGPPGPPGPPGPKGDKGDPGTTPVVVPPVVTPPVVTPPTGARPGIYFDGKTLRNRAGVAQGPFCSVEAMLYSLADITTAVAQAKAIGATAMGPLLDGNLETAVGVAATLDQTLAAQLICWLNFDHAGDLWKRPDVRTVVNDPKYPHVGLELAVELGSGMSAEAWRTQAITTGKEISAAFPDRPFRIGLPDGGRNPGPAIKYGKDVLAGIGHRAGCWFAPQAYWSKTSGWYQSLASSGLPTGAAPFRSGINGTLDAIRYLASLAEAWGVGTDMVDHVGLTGQAEILEVALALGMPAQSWALSGDGMGNNLFSGGVLTQAGLEVQRVFLRYPRIAL